MAEKKHLTCVECPLGCYLELIIVADKIQTVTGNDCKLGEIYARQEYTDPRRMVSATVSCIAGLWPRLPVKTAAVVPKNKVMEIARILRSFEVEAPVQMGQIILNNVAGTGIAVVASRSLSRVKTAEDKR